MGRLAGGHLYVTCIYVFRESTAEVFGELNYVIAADELIAKELMVEHKSPDYPVADGWEMRVHVRAVNDDLVIELGQELAAAKKKGKR